MSQNSKTCSTCLKSNDDLINAEDVGEDGVKWSSKLSFCIPELEWKREDCLLCGACTCKLQIVYEFRKLCLESYEIRTKHDDVKCEGETDSLDANECDEAKDPFCLSLNELSHLFKTKTNKLLDVEDYVCFHCNESFTDKLTLTEHISDAHGPKSECQICRNSFAHQDALENHLIHEHKIGETKSTRKTKKHKCLKCSRMYTTERIMKIHSVNCDGIKRHKPDEIKSEFTKPKLKRGRKPKEKQINKCETCSVVFSTKYLLNRHVRNVHATEKLHNCDICGQKFASPVYLSAHKRYHSRERPHICSFCGKGYITASDLYHHEKIHANKRAYKCEKCPKAFNTSSDLHKHRICVHVDRSEWKYVCSFCERRFPLKTNLDTHTKTHTGERNFACHLCDRRCINRSVLLRHIESHSNVRSFRCNVCNQDYKYQKSLDIHMTKAHGIGDAKIPERVKKYFCHVCPKSYFANNKLQKHIRTHTGERPFACQMCDKRFIDKSYVKQHLKTAHNLTFNTVP